MDAVGEQKLETRNQKLAHKLAARACKKLRPDTDNEGNAKQKRTHKGTLMILSSSVVVVVVVICLSLMLAPLHSREKETAQDSSTALAQCY